MKLSLSETADLIGKSERQLRYMIRAGRLKADKSGGRWQIDSADLPLTEGQRTGLAERLDVAREALASGLVLPAKAAAEAGKQPFSVTDYDAFKIGVALYGELETALGPTHLALTHLFRALGRLTRGCHAFRPADKAACFVEARESVADVVTCLLVEPGEGPARAELARRFEAELIPRIGGLVAVQERRGRRGRFEQFGSRYGGDASR